jgi:hypothetical protein
VNAFHVCGVLFGIWAVIVAVLGITRDNFPGSKRAMRLVATISFLLAAAAIGTAVYVGATEKKGEKKGGERGSAARPV